MTTKTQARIWTVCAAGWFVIGCVSGGAIELLVAAACGTVAYILTA